MVCNHSSVCYKIMRDLCKECPGCQPSGWRESSVEVILFYEWAGGMAEGGGWLAALPELRSLNLNGCTTIQHITLAAATKLEMLDISGCGALQQLLVPSLALRALFAAGCSHLQVGHPEYAPRVLAHFTLPDLWEGFLVGADHTV